MLFFIKNNPEKLLGKFKKTNETELKTKIIIQLIKLDAEKEILEIFKENKTEIIEYYLFRKYKDNPERLFWLYQNGVDKQKTIEQMIKLDAEKEILEIFKENKTKIIQNYLLQKYIKNNDMKRLRQIRKTVEPSVYYANEIDLSKLGFNSFFSKYFDIIKLIKTNESLFQKFFSSLSGKYKLYFFLSHFNLKRFLPALEYSQKYKNLLIYFDKIGDCVSYKLDNFSKLFEEVYSVAQKEKSIELFRLAYLLDKKKYQQKLKYIETKLIISNDLSFSRRNLDKRYSGLINNATQKQEVERLINEKKQEIKSLYSKEIYDLQNNILFFPKPIKKNDFAEQEKNVTNKIYKFNLEHILKEYTIVENVENSKSLINSNLKRQLEYLEDANEIMKLKNRANKNIDSLVSIKDFCHIVECLKPNLTDKPQVINILGKILSETKFEQVRKAILIFSAKSTNRLWLKYIHKISYLQKLQSDILNSIKNKFSTWNLKFLSKISNLTNNSIRKIRTLNGHSRRISSVSFSRDGQTLASYSDDRTIKLWDVATGREIKAISGNFPVFSPEGQILASCGGEEIKLWDVATGREIKAISGNFPVFSPEGQILASCGGEEIKLWNVTTGREIKTLRGHSDYICSVSFSPDGQTLASCSGEEIKLWDVATGKEIKTISGHSPVFSPDGHTLASVDYCTIKLWNVATGKEIKALSGHSNDIKSVSFSPDGQILASGSRDKTVKLWDVGAGREIKTLGHSDHINSVSFSPDSKILASVSNDGTIKLWNVATGKEIKTLSGHSPVFSPDGQTLASVDYWTIKLWNVATGKEIKTLSGHSNDIKSVSFSPDSKILAFVSDDKTIKLWDLSLYLKAQLVLINHLLYFTLNPSVEDIKDLIEFKNNIHKLPSNMQKPIENIVNNIIEKAGKESKTIEISSENKPESKDIEIKY